MRPCVWTERGHGARHDRPCNLPGSDREAGQGRAGGAAHRQLMDADARRLEAALQHPIVVQQHLQLPLQPVDHLGKYIHG